MQNTYIRPIKKPCGYSLQHDKKTWKTNQAILRVKSRINGCSPHKWNRESKTKEQNSRTKWTALNSNKWNDFSISKKTKKNQKRRRQLQQRINNNGYFWKILKQIKIKMFFKIYLEYLR